MEAQTLSLPTFSYYTKMSFVQYLAKKGVIEKKRVADLEYEIKASGKREEEALLEMKIVPEDFLFELKSENLKIPLRQVTPEEISLETLEMIPAESARYYQMAPLVKKDDFLEVGMVYPEDFKAQEALNFLARQGKFEYKVFLITPSSFGGVLKQYKNLKQEVKKALEEFEAEIESRPTFKRKVEFERMAEDAPVTKVVANILRHAAEGKASDVHIEPTRKNLRVRFRMDGILHSSLILPIRVHPAVIARIKILSNLKIDETRMPQDGRFSTEIEKRYIDFRVSTFPTTLGEKAVLRLLDPTEGIKKFEELGLEDRNYKIIKETMAQPYGMVLATGPTGSGKTTTLYAMMSVLNQEGVNVMTLEDPVEYFMPGVNQSQVKPEIGYTFSSGLRHMLRQDPDIMMVGEIRDNETAELATHASLTGHLVLSTLHTNNVLGVIPRLVDLGVASFLIPSSLSIALGQRLVRVLCPHCKKKIVAPSKIKEMIVEEMEGVKQVKLPKSIEIYSPQGCKKCKSTGYSGRMGIYEILEMTPQLAEIILREPSVTRIKEEADRQGMTTMKQDGIIKVLDGVTSIEEVLRVAEEM